MKKRSFLSAVLAVGMGVIFLLQSGKLSEGIRRGLSVCSYSVIPSLFPFMALSVFICKSSAADFLATLFKPVTKFLKLPSICAGALLSSFFGGYPAGAKCINDLVESGCLSRETAARMLCFCVNAGPPFLISAVGIGVFKSIEIGIILFAAQIFSSVLIAVITALFSKNTDHSLCLTIPERKSTASCMIESVTSAAESCFNMCAFIVISCGALEILFGGPFFNAIAKNEFAKALFSGFIEVTAGCFACGEIKGFLAVAAAGAISAFSGVSVMLQIAAATDRSKIPLLPFIISRFFNAAAVFSAVMLILKLFPVYVPAFSVKGENYEAVLSASAPAAVSLLCMASLFLLSLVPPKSEKEPFFTRLRNIFSEKQIKF